MTQVHQNVEMQDKPDGCLSPVDEEREPCLKSESPADKNNGSVTVPLTGENNKNPSPTNNNNAAPANGHGKFHPFAVPTTLEQHLLEMTGFSRVGLFVAMLALVLCAVLTISLVTMLFVWPRPQRMYPVCRSASCLRASAEVLPKMNLTVSPCTNFKGYACDGWLETNSLPAYMSTWSLKKRIQQEQKVSIRNMVVTLRNVASSNSLNWKMKNFYESCMNLDNIETDEGKPLKKIISTILGGWHVLKDFDVHSWDLPKNIVQLHSEYSVSPFFKIDVVPDDKVSGQNIIQISPAGLGLPDRRYYYRQQDQKIVAAYKQYMVDVSQMLGATSSDASIFSNDMFHYEKRIAEITPAGRQEDPFTSHRRFKLSKLKEIAGMIPLLDILQSKFPDCNISDDTFVSVVSPTYFSNLSNLISSSERSGLNDYFMWKMAEAYVPYLSVKFREIVKIYMAELTGEKDLPPRWETCVSLLQNFMGIGVSASLEANAENKDEIVASVVNIFENIRETIKSNVESSQDMESELREHVLGKLNSLTIQVGLPAGLLDEKNVSQFYSQLSIQKLDFFVNVNHAISFANYYSQIKLKFNKEEYGWLDDLVAEDPKVRYNVASNKVIVPMSMLSPPYFETGYPDALLYGGIGVEISSAILSSVYPPGVAYGKDGVLLTAHSAAVNRSIGATSEARACFGHFFKDQQIMEVENNTALTGLLSVSSVQYALQSLLKITDPGLYYHQPAMESYEYNQLFFIAYAQSQCTIKSPQQQDLDAMYDLMSDESLLLKSVADYTDGFRDAFHCSWKPNKTCKKLY
ncbi:Peptidase M13, C-terminal domain,Peptidase M13,Peptidase M13, N-terminal domain [Cinara cedri]|uniref:Peptidase M13, C-terminal domain,Peptidase M13,Peptidase M13, N-terminal domain n=1 Tax=Cinara cedri TaxID=506608 RepID=A0A5E4MR32_9HEMI|nr:Peptidase M13, C-terminal domain,Peptidase M13,Peptidase M13, N-terminal domain [Cinara cedri]